MVPLTQSRRGLLAVATRLGRATRQLRKPGCRNQPHSRERPCEASCEFFRVWADPVEEIVVFYTPRNNDGSDTPMMTVHIEEMTVRRIP